MRPTRTGGSAARQRTAIDLIAALPPERTFLPAQALGELFAILVKRGGRSRTDARLAVLHWGDTFPLIESSSDVVLRAMDLANDHQMFAWDAFILASAAEANCRLLLSGRPSGRVHLGWRNSNESIR